LHIAAKNARGDVVQAFLAAGADADAVDMTGNSPLDLAEDPRVALLLAAVVTPQWTGRLSTPLHDASRRVARDAAWAKVVELLLERGADPGLRDGLGRVHALAAHPAVGVLAATEHGLRRRAR
jgi:ankyrin repeat protein